MADNQIYQDHKRYKQVTARIGAIFRRFSKDFTFVVATPEKNSDAEVIGVKVVCHAVDQPTIRGDIVIPADNFAGEPHRWDKTINREAMAMVKKLRARTRRGPLKTVDQV